MDLAGAGPATCVQTAECGIVGSISSNIQSLFSQDTGWPVTLHTIEQADGVPPVDVWVWRIDSDPGRAACERECLSRDELARAERLRTPELKLRFETTRGRLRRILAEYVRVPARELPLEYGESGKPSVAAFGRPAPQFNLTHSDRLAALAVSWTQHVGIDIECVQPVEGQVAQEAFSPAEIAALDKFPEDERLLAFYRGWTRKEAILKAIGKGLSLPLKSFEVSQQAEPAQILRAATFSASEWRLIDFSPDPAHIGAIALSAARLTMTVHPTLTVDG